MIITAQGSSGAGKTTALQSLSAECIGAIYVPELLADRKYQTDEDFVKNDVAKAQAVQKEMRPFFVDRDGLSTLALIAARDGANSLEYRELKSFYAEQYAAGLMSGGDAYLRFSVSYDTSVSRQQATNDGIWRDLQVVGRYESMLDEIIGEFIDGVPIHRIDGEMSKHEVKLACLEAITAARQSIDLDPEKRYVNAVVPSYEAVSEDIEGLGLIILKPDCVEKQLAGYVENKLSEIGYEILTTRNRTIDVDGVLRIWQNYGTSGWWEDTANYMMSDESKAILVRARDRNVYDDLSQFKKKLRETFMKTVKPATVTSLVHSADCEEELRRNLLAYWESDELDRIIKK